MITGAAQQYRATSLTAISAVKGQNIEPGLPVPGRRTETAASSSAVVNIEAPRPLADAAKKFDVRNMSPRDMATMSQALYQSGTISFRDHALLSFQPELGQQFNATLPGAPGEPDAPRDFLAQWEAQLQIHEKLGDAEFAKNDQRVLNILGNLAALRESAATA